MREVAFMGQLDHPNIIRWRALFSRYPKLASTALHSKTLLSQQPLLPAPYRLLVVLSMPRLRLRRQS